MLDEPAQPEEEGDRTDPDENDGNDNGADEKEHDSADDDDAPPGKEDLPGKPQPKTKSVG